MKAVRMLFLTTVVEGGLGGCMFERTARRLNRSGALQLRRGESSVLLHVADLDRRRGGWVPAHLVAEGVEFAPRPGFRPSARAWTEENGDDAWLVLDRDGDGVINDASEMFGDATPQPHPAEGTLRNGFLALAQHDDGNGTLDENDAIFPELRLWQDRDHDGVSQPAELHMLPGLGVAGVSLSYAEAREVDQHGNSFRYRSAVCGTPGSRVGMTAWDVWLVGTEPEPAVSLRAADASSSGGGCGGGEEGRDPIPPRMDCTGLACVNAKIVVTSIVGM
jgi:hypothetical protein